MLFQELCGSWGIDFPLANQHSWHEMYALELGDVNPNSNTCQVRHLAKKNGNFSMKPRKKTLCRHVTCGQYSLILILGLLFCINPSLKMPMRPQKKEPGLFQPIPRSQPKQPMQKIPPCHAKGPNDSNDTQDKGHWQHLNREGA